MNDDEAVNDEPAPTDNSGSSASPTSAIADELIIRDLEVLRVISDRLRLRIVEAFGRTHGASRTVKEVAKELGEPPTKLYYHVNLLEQHGILVVAESNLVSGIMEKRYVPAAKSFRVDRRLLEERGAADGGAAGAAVADVLESVFESTADDFRRALAAGFLEVGETTGQPERALLTRAAVRLTDASAANLVKALREIVETQDETEATNTYALTVAFFREGVDGMDEDEKEIEA
jgi:Helix-turn-helix domain